MRICSKCHTEKPDMSFGKDRTKKSGTKSQCKDCINAQRRVDQPTVKPGYLLCKQCNTEKEATLEYFYQRGLEVKGRISRCKKCSIAATKQYRKDNPDVSKEYKKSNKFKESRRRYESNKRKNNLNYRLTKVLRNRLFAALKGRAKKSTTFELLGCTIDEFRDHISAQFIGTMSWKNYGDWHIDHIKPCAAFNLECLEEQQKCFHYSNMQPLWAEDNLRKSDTY
jgi:hypothetical protein